MPADSKPKAVALYDDPWTVGAVAVLAFVLADVAHEVIGHGIGFLAAGGRSCILTTTRLIENQRLGDRGGEIFDLGGPLGNLGFAALAWLTQRLLGRRAERLRLLLWLVMAFNLFWGFGYLIFGGVFARGDWFSLVQRANPGWLWRLVLVVAGIVLYRASERLVAAELHWIVPVGDADRPLRVRRLVMTSYLAGGLIACAGAALDPRGAIETLNSGALSSFVAALGLLQTPRLFPGRPDKHGASENVVSRSVGWMLAATAVSVFFITILGPGVKVTL